MHADEETKHSQEQGPSSTICLSSSRPSWTRFVWPSGAPIWQQASFKQSVPALRCRPCLGKGLTAYKIKVKSMFVANHFTTTMASSS